jgi:hypothetical protein
MRRLLVAALASVDAVGLEQREQSGVLHAQVAQRCAHGGAVFRRAPGCSK